MKQLRKYIRKLILETPAMQSQVGNMIFNHGQADDPYPKDTESGQYHKDYAIAHKDIFNLGPGRVPKAKKEKNVERMDKFFDLKRDVKRFWNDNADHAWIKANVLPIHDLTYYAGFDEDIKDMDLMEFIKKYPPGIKQDDEMSAYGYHKKGIYTGDEKPAIGIILKGRITYLQAGDAFTESRSLTTVQDEKRHKPSGLPKRPGIASDFDPAEMIFDKEDAEKNHFFSSGGIIGEVVVDNWTYDTIIFNIEKLMRKNRDFSRRQYRRMLNDTFAKLKATGLTILMN